MIGAGGLCVLLLIFCSISSFSRRSENENKSELSLNSEASDLDEENLSDDTTLNLYYFHSLISDEDCKLYDLILAGVLSHDSSIILPANIEEKLQEITQMILNDYPEIFWVDGVYQYTAYDDKTDLKINYLYGKDEISFRTREIEATVNDFNRLLSSGDTEYQSNSVFASAERNSNIVCIWPGKCN